MREILFRGKRKDNGEWVEGDLVRLHNPKKNELHIAAQGDNQNWAHTKFIEILPATIGQYTGQKDRNGKRIFEGDKVAERGR